MITSVESQEIRDGYFAMDVETTGLSAAFGHRVIEIGAVCVQEGTVISEFEQLIHTSRNISRTGRSMMLGLPPESGWRCKRTQEKQRC